MIALTETWHGVRPLIQKEKWTLVFDGIPMFAGLNEKQQSWLADRLNYATYPAGVDIITAGDQGERVYIIHKGTVKVFMPQVDGSEVTVVILGPGDTVGELSLLDDDERSASVGTLEETQVFWMTRDHLEEAMQFMPVLARNLLRILSKRLRFSTSNIQSLACLDVNGRVAQQLLVFAERYGKKAANGDIYIAIRLPQNDIAELVGASRKRVNQTMVSLKRDGCISIDNEYHITIHDRRTLEEWANIRV
ncbi:MAG TPA: Crp/Fnr family transcriptional regulator [Anaerolineaceae bacterium]|nr:Crp/Fnr family transcriptional regulator [Anaerolineaceae bacterium]HPN50812.1 Crp/Fnr family transcriptional regulator [Anaerolineaceae bacterium]